MNLSKEKCTPCATGDGRLSATEVDGLIAGLTQWKVVGAAISRRFEFKNFKQSLTFVNQVGAIAEAEGHHPDITFGWGYAEILLTSHKAKGLTRNDFIMAAKVDGVVG
jgi:4a-hydroxytetrahydrobiopterin dehydratase